MAQKFLRYFRFVAVQRYATYLAFDGRDDELKSDHLSDVYNTLRGYRFGEGTWRHNKVILTWMTFLYVHDLVLDLACSRSVQVYHAIQGKKFRCGNARGVQYVVGSFLGP